MTTLLKCPICGGTERSLLPGSVCEECGCDMKPDASDARRVLFDKSQPKEARMAAMNVLQTKPAQPRDTPRDSGDAALRAANKLAAAAMTTGGTAGADPHLQEAIDAFIAARDAAMQSTTGEPT